jgi:hypothetical protein
MTRVMSYCCEKNCDDWKMNLSRNLSKAKKFSQVGVGPKISAYKWPNVENWGGKLDLTNSLSKFQCFLSSQFTFFLHVEIMVLKVPEWSSHFSNDHSTIKFLDDFEGPIAI